MQKQDGNAHVKLKYLNEIRFGPRYYQAFVEGQRLKGIFGRMGEFSDNKRYLALEEWLTLDYQKGPITRPFIIDLQTVTYAVLETIDKGRVGSSKFEGVRFIYQRDKHIHRFPLRDIEVDMSDIQNWQPLNYAGKAPPGPGGNDMLATIQM